MKGEIKPGVAAAIIIIILAVVGFFVWRGTSGGAGNLPTGATGHAGPFSPGGEMAGKGGNQGAHPAVRPGGSTGPPPGIGR